MKRAFTLIELLVVIAIIAILAAILFPVFAQAKLAAKKTVGLSNVKNLATAAMLYSGDNDDMRCPEYGYYDDATKQNIYWFGSTTYPATTVDYKKGLLYPYTKSGDIIDSPTNKGIRADPYTGINFGLAMNRGAFIVDGTMAIEDGYLPDEYSMTAFESPAETIFFGDAATENYVGGSYLLTDTSEILCNYNTVHGRNGGKVANLAWYDGHAKGMRVTPSVAQSGEEYYAAQNNLGVLSKFPLKNTQGGTYDMTARDCYYYTPKKVQN